MGNSTRDKLERGEGNLDNRVGGKDLMPQDDHHHSIHRKQIIWHRRVLHEDLEKMSQQLLYL